MGAKHSTIVLCRGFTSGVYPAIGYLKRKGIRANHLNSFYTSLPKLGQNKRTGGQAVRKSPLEYHRLISTVLDQAERERLVPLNVGP